MDGISAASAILGVAQIGFQFSQVLVTVIGDYRDAAKNINRLRDEIHLTSIGLQQLGDLASKYTLHKSKFGILEATNLRERCQATFWEIRTAIRKGDIHTSEITKDQIDVTCFSAVKWALYTKNKLAEPRQELDRLKDSLTLCFLSYMAVLTTNDLERAKYTSQIPGIKRSLNWSQTGPEEDYFENRLRQVGIAEEKIAEILGTEFPVIKTSVKPSPHEVALTRGPVLKAWSLDPLAKIEEVSLSTPWLEKFLAQEDPGEKNIWQVQSMLHPWFKNELNNLPLDKAYSWSLVYLKPTFKHFWRRQTPQNLQVVMRGIPLETTVSEIPPNGWSRIAAFEEAAPFTVENSINGDGVVIIPIEAPMTQEAVVDETTDVETDEQIIAKQLALYQ